MDIFTTEGFATKRRKDQDKYATELLPVVEKALKSLGDGSSTWNADLLAAVERVYTEIYSNESEESLNAAALASVIKSVKKALKQTKPDSDSESISLALANTAINAATIAAADADPQELELEWVTIGDSKVRHSHRETAGQRRPPGKVFDVDGVAMDRPGDMSAPIELWINCRCVVRPDLASAGSLAADGSQTPEDSAAVWQSGEGIKESLGEEMTVGPEETVKEDPATEDDSTPVAGALVPWHGVLAPEGIMSGDRRMFAEGSLSIRPLPMPLTWQKTSSEGHMQSVVVATIEETEMVDGLMMASGFFLQTPEGDEVVGLISAFGRFGVSVDADNITLEMDDANDMSVFTEARVSSACIVPIPAFAEAWVALGPRPGVDVSPSTEEALAASAVDFGRGPGWLTNPVATKRIHDYWTVPGQAGYEKIGWGVPGDFNRCRVEVGEEIGEGSPDKLRFLNQICAQWHHDAIGIWPGQEKLAAASLENTEAAPALSLVATVGHTAPAAWFKDPEFESLTPLTVDPEGRVFGHVAGWETCHLSVKGMDGGCTAPPHSATNYSYFAIGQVLTEEGPVSVGNITIGGGHAGGRLNPREAAAHYDSTSMVGADVAIGEDAFGIWVAGWVRPGVDDNTVTALRASKVSGDWRRMRDGSFELIAALAVNSPGFPAPRLSASNGVQISLVAAGYVPAAEDGKPEFDMAKFASSVNSAIQYREAQREKMAVLTERFRKDR